MTATVPMNCVELDRGGGLMEWRANLKKVCELEPKPEDRDGGMWSPLGRSHSHYTVPGGGVGARATP